MEFPEDRLYSEYHLWVKPEKKVARIGLTEYAVEELGDVDYLELPSPDEVLTMGAPFGTIETSKAVTDLIAPISGIVVETNTSLAKSPDTISSDPYGDGWLVMVEPSDSDELKDLTAATAYREKVQSLDDPDD